MLSLSKCFKGVIDDQLSEVKKKCDLLAQAHFQRYQKTCQTIV